ncbi:MAG TPA: ABC transporter permease, partial [Candidatus Polarisedimenticolia bacterium]|nr:ABC transporter permease [Candidatus Polarisedimenticolia bacterium]
MSILAQDIRFAARMLMKHPAVSLVAVITLALGIGANTAVFSWIDAFLLRPIPGAERTDRIVVVQQTSAEGSHSNLSYPEYLDFRERAVSLAGLIAYDMQAMNLGGDGKPERIWGTLVTGNYFDVLGVRAALGRTFLPDEDLSPGARPVVVISHGLWQRRFAADPGIVGRSITLNNSAFTVVGVAQPDFQGNFTGLAMEAWVPTMMQEVIVPGGDRLSVRGSRWLESMARLAPGATREQAQAELSTIAAAMARESGAAGSGDSMVTLTPLWRAGPAEVLGPVLMLTLGVVGLLLLIACANVASLALARAASRRREVAVRLALGAGRARLIRQMLTESLLLSALGGLAGWVLALWCAGLLMNLAPPVDFPLALAIRLDWRIFAFNLAVSMAAGVIFGLFPALQASRPNLVTALKNESAAVTGEARRNRFRNGLVVAQVAMSLLLLVFAGLLLRSLQSARSLDPGFNSDGVLLASLDLF